MIKSFRMHPSQIAVSRLHISEPQLTGEHSQENRLFDVLKERVVGVEPEQYCKSRGRNQDGIEDVLTES